MRTKTYGSGSGTHHGYVVEVRTTYPSPSVFGRDFNSLQRYPEIDENILGGFIIDGEWRQFPARIVASRHGIPVRNWCRQADECDLLNYEAAMTLAHWIVAASPIQGGCMQTRLVEVQLTYSYATKEVGVGPVIHLSEMQRTDKFTPRESGLGAEVKP